jgi:hypothetical protein
VSFFLHWVRGLTHFYVTNILLFVLVVSLNLAFELGLNRLNNGCNLLIYFKHVYYTCAAGITDAWRYRSEWHTTRTARWRLPFPRTCCGLGAAQCKPILVMCKERHYRHTRTPQDEYTLPKHAVHTHPRLTQVSEEDEYVFFLSLHLLRPRGRTVQAYKCCVLGAASTTLKCPGVLANGMVEEGKKMARTPILDQLHRTANFEQLEPKIGSLPFPV